jgi:alkanesulfonate monooxygenase SsuD/methylene tetrahydromethanopterin reductase-like flavin-dependent oxidoreductase (luciferase family)
VTGAQTPAGGQPTQAAGRLQAGICHMPRDPATGLALARVAETAGLDVFGVADSQHLFGALYPVIQHVLSGTGGGLDDGGRLRVGPLVTNPVTQHASVHAASLAALASLYPGRVLAAFGAGDSAVRSVGLAPASRAKLAADVGYIGDRLGGAVPLWVAVSGPKAAAAVPPAASAVLLGGGLEPAWLSELGGLAEASAGHRLQRWAFLAGSLVADLAQLPAARAALAVTVAGISRHGMTADPVRAGAPPALVPGLRALYAQLDVQGHGQPAGRNRDVLAAWPAQADYLFTRFAVVGTPEQAAQRLRPVAAQAGLTGFIFSSTVPDPAAHITLIGQELLPLLTPESTPTN